RSSRFTFARHVGRCSARLHRPGRTGTSGALAGEKRARPRPRLTCLRFRCQPGGPVGPDSPAVGSVLIARSVLTGSHGEEVTGLTVEPSAQIGSATGRE